VALMKNIIPVMMAVPPNKVPSIFNLFIIKNADNDSTAKNKINA
jgi:hypothetical protein